MAELIQNNPYDALLANIEQMKAQYKITVSPFIEFRANPVDGIGIYASQAIPSNSTLIEVPFASVLSSQAVSSFPALQGIFEDNPGLLDYPDEVLCVGLLYALHHDSPWSLHVSTMPRVFGTPLYWTEEVRTTICTVY
ncbi:hypothetical protein EON63_14495 [archaeon]|nr:MAG: hypothetical protein EON63_14495 [archaeon]